MHNAIAKLCDLYEALIHAIKHACDYVLLPLAVLMPIWLAATSQGHMIGISAVQGAGIIGGAVLLALRLGVLPSSSKPAGSALSADSAALAVVCIVLVSAAFSPIHGLAYLACAAGIKGSAQLPRGEPSKDDASSFTSTLGLILVIVLWALWIHEVCAFHEWAWTSAVATLIAKVWLLLRCGQLLGETILQRHTARFTAP